MAYLTYSQIKNSRSIQSAVGVCADDPRLVEWLNNSESRMLNQGRWWGSIRQMVLCVTDGCITFPREVENFEQLSINNQNVPIFTQSYGYTQSWAVVKPCAGCCGAGGVQVGPFSGLGWASCGHLQGRDQGQASSFAVTRSNNKFLRVYCNVADVGKQIIFQGRDENGIWVRTSIDGSIQDGEQVTLAMPYVDTTTIWGPGNPVCPGVIKDETDYLVRVYAVDPDGVETAIAVYQPSETRPTYRTLKIPNFRGIQRNCCPAGENTVNMTCLVKLAHVPIATDNDWLIFENIMAYQSAIQAEKYYQEGNFAAGNTYFYGTQAAPSNGRNGMRVVNRGAAIPLLQAELQSKGGGRTDIFTHFDYNNRYPALLANFR